MAPTCGALRLTRAAIFSLSAVGLAVAAHVAGGERVGLPVALVCVVAVMLVVNLLAARRRGPVGLVLVMGLTQVLLHAALMVGDLAGGCRMSARHLSAPVSERHIVVTDPTCGSVAMAGHQAADMFTMSPRMFAAHAIATVLLALLLARGEAAVWTLVAGLGLRLVLPRTPVLLPARRRPAVLPREALLPRADVPRHGVRRRGPPRPAPVSGH